MYRHKCMLLHSGFCAQYWAMRRWTELADGSLLTVRHIRVQMHTANAATTNKRKLVSVGIAIHLLTEIFCFIRYYSSFLGDGTIFSVPIAQLLMFFLPFWVTALHFLFLSPNFWCFSYLFGWRHCIFWAWCPKTDVISIFLGGGAIFPSLSPKTRCNFHIFG